MRNGPIYDLGEQLSSADGITTYRATVRSTGEAVYIHALPIGTAELYDLALRHFRSFSVEKPVLNVFTFEGRPYVVTRPNAETIRFRPWLGALPGLDRKELGESPVIFQARSENEFSIGNRIDKDIPSFTQLFQSPPGTGRPADSAYATAKTPSENIGESTALFGPGRTVDSASIRSPEKPAAAVPYLGSNAATLVSPQKPEGKSERPEGKDAASKLPSFSTDFLPEEPKKPSRFTEVFGPGAYPVPVLSDNKAEAPVVTKDKTVGGFTQFFGPQVELANRSEPVGPSRLDSNEPDVLATEPAYGDSTRIFRGPIPHRPRVAPPSGGSGEYTEFYEARPGPKTPLADSTAPAAAPTNAASGGIAITVQPPSVSTPSLPLAPSLPPISAPQLSSINTSAEISGRFPEWLPLLIVGNIAVLIIIGLVLYFLLRK
jgi:hypothetical protein